jgi:hypothetical protein
MSRSSPEPRVMRASGCPARHGMPPSVDARAAGATAIPTVAVAPPPVSTASNNPSGPASAPLAVSAGKAVLTTFEGQAVFKILPPGSAEFRAGDVLRFAYGSRTTRARTPW